MRWAIFCLILRHVVGRPKATFVSSSAHADPICGCQTYCFLLARLHGLPIALLKETERQHALVPYLESLRHGGFMARCCQVLCVRFAAYRGRRATPTCRPDLEQPDQHWRISQTITAVAMGSPVHA